jgi:hypothetical protein
MPPTEPLVTNAADRGQLERARRSEKSRERQEVEDFKEMASSTIGRRFLWQLLGRCGTFKSVWHPSAQIHYLAGQQDIGHYYLSLFMTEAPEHFLTMLKENGNAS